MKPTLMLIKISLILKKLFDKQTGADLEAMKTHFEAAYSDAQLCALACVGMIIRVFGLAPEPAQNSRSIWNVVGLFVQFLKSLDGPADTMRSAPTPLDGLVAEGLDEFEHLARL
jgi:hypothetical protein